MMNHEHLRDASAGPAAATILASQPNRKPEHDRAARQTSEAASFLARQPERDGNPPSPSHDLQQVFSRRTSEALNSACVSSWERLLRSTPAELLRIRDFGQVCLAEVREELAAHGLRLRGDC
jgi:DNA-directed RNA polymerase alpha subunit